MPLEQTITVVNNSGKIIATGKHLFSIFKEAKASYDEKKAEIRAIKRAETFDHSHRLRRDEEGSRGHHRPGTYAPEYYSEYDYGRNPEYHGDGRRRHSSFDIHSEAGSRRSHRSAAHNSHSKHRHVAAPSRPALTESNLKTLSETSSTGPSQLPPTAHCSPGAETMQKDVVATRTNLGHFDMRSMTETEWRQRNLPPRRRSESEVDRRGTRRAKEIDMNLAYGNIPPDLEFRIDLDPARADEYQANLLVRRVEGLLDEAHCVQHSATSIIKHLQEKPDAAAAVALTLAELSSVVGKMSPAFVGFLRSGSPAVFSLLASPQFLIGTGIAVGLTVVMFGGWKIVKRVKEQGTLAASGGGGGGRRARALAWEGTAANRPASLPARSDPNNGGIDEALVVNEELSTIESWRRGIMPPGADNESAEIELITPEAERARRGKQRERIEAGHAPSLRSAQTAKTGAPSTRTSRSGKTHKTSSSRTKEREMPERRGSWNATVETVISGASDSGSRRSSRRAKDKEKEKEKESPRGERRMITEGSTKGMELVYRPRGQSQGDTLLKALFKNKDRKERESRSELAMA